MYLKYKVKKNLKVQKLKTLSNIFKEKIEGSNLTV